MFELKQHCALILSDSPETDELIIKSYGFTGTKRIEVPVGFQWQKAFRNEESHDIYIVRLDEQDLDWLSRFGFSGTREGIWTATGEIYKRYFIPEEGRRPETMDVWFDIVAVGTPNVLVLKKRRGTDVTPDWFITRP